MDRIVQDTVRCRDGARGSSRRLHARHIQHWEDGGPTDQSNLKVLCSFRHTFMHEKGWEIRPCPMSGAHALFPPASKERTIEDRLVGSPSEAVRMLTEEWGLELHHESLLPQFWDGTGYDHDLAIDLLFKEIVATNQLDAPAEAPSHS